MRLSEVNCPLKQSIETSGWEIGNSYDTLAFSIIFPYFLWENGGLFEDF